MQYFSQYRGGASNPIPFGLLQTYAQTGSAIGQGIANAGEGIMQGVNQMRANKQEVKHLRGLLAGYAEMEAQAEGSGKEGYDAEVVKGTLDSYKDRLETLSLGELRQEAGRFAGMFQQREQDTSNRYKDAMSKRMEDSSKPASNVARAVVDESGNPIPGQFILPDGQRVSEKEMGQHSITKIVVGENEYTLSNGRQIGEPVPVANEADMGQLRQMQTTLRNLETMAQQGIKRVAWENGQPREDTWLRNGEPIAKAIQKIRAELENFQSQMPKQADVSSPTQNDDPLGIR